MGITKKQLFISLLFCLTATAWSRQKPRCVSITRSFCKDIGFEKMRTPNFLNHDTAKEVYAELNQWAPLVSSRCHPRLTLFLCSMYTPVCLDQEIKPCRSLCSDVRKSCEPLMNRRNYTWPQPFECSKFPANNLCINAAQVPTKPPGKNKGNTCTIDRKAKLSEVQKSYCKSDFAIRARLQEKKPVKENTQLVIKVDITKILKGNLSVNKKGVLRIRVPLNGLNDCKTLSSKRLYFILGKQKGKKVIATSILRWRKKYKKVKTVRCPK